MFQAGEMVADTLGYTGYQNRSSDSGRVIARVKGGKVNCFTMCAEEVWQFFSLLCSTLSGLKMKAHSLI